MGIPGLLPLMASIMDKVHISAYRGHRVAVDAYCWLHRGIFTCAEELVRGQRSTKFVDYFMERVRLLLRNGVTPVLVFDGGRLPQKGATDRLRRTVRKQNKAKALALLREGHVRGADRFISKALEVTPDMASQVIQELKKQNIEFIVAPYEADAQLAYLSHQGLVQAVISEDSDLIPFGCKRILFKMDRSGYVEEFRMEDLGANTALDFFNWNLDMIQQMCILSGCDYLNGLKGMGLRRAHSLVKKKRTHERTLRELQLRVKDVPAEYPQQFQAALLTFKHQRVYDPRAKKLVHLTPMPHTVRISVSDDAFLGHFLDDATAQGIATGVLNPETLKPYTAHQKTSPSQEDSFSSSTPALPAATPPPFTHQNSSSQSSFRGSSMPRQKTVPRKKKLSGTANDPICLDLDDTDGKSDSDSDSFPAWPFESLLSDLRGPRKDSRVQKIFVQSSPLRSMSRRKYSTPQRPATGLPPQEPVDVDQLTPDSSGTPPRVQLGSSHLDLVTLQASPILHKRKTDILSQEPARSSSAADARRLTRRAGRVRKEPSFPRAVSPRPTKSRPKSGSEDHLRSDGRNDRPAASRTVDVAKRHRLQALQLLEAEAVAAAEAALGVYQENWNKMEKAFGGTTGASLKPQKPHQSRTLKKSPLMRRSRSGRSRSRPPLRDSRGALLPPSPKKGAEKHLFTVFEDESEEGLENIEDEIPLSPVFDCLLEEDSNNQRSSSMNRRHTASSSSKPSSFLPLSERLVLPDEEFEVSDLLKTSPTGDGRRDRNHGRQRRGRGREEHRSILCFLSDEDDDHEDASETVEDLFQPLSPQPHQRPRFPSPPPTLLPESPRGALPLALKDALGDLRRVRSGPKLSLYR